MTKKARHYRTRLERQRTPSVTGVERRGMPGERELRADATVDCGWGRLIFAHTFRDNRRLADALLSESPGKRDIAFYVADPHVLLAMEPQNLFLDPSHTYRLWLDRYKVSALRPRGYAVHLLNSRADAEGAHRVYLARQMIPPPVDFMWQKRTSKVVHFLVAIDIESGEVLGVATGIDHVEAFGDPENGASLWALAVDPQARSPGIGQALVRHLVEFFIARGRSYLDLSVMHDNREAIRLYERLTFRRINTFTVKNKNSINEPLFIGTQPQQRLNPYARIITREAQRRGIGVDVLDAEAGFFELALGGRTVTCRESLSELTTSIAMSRCDDKAVTHRLLAGAGLRVPAQAKVEDLQQADAFLAEYGAVVVKPARGEQGAGISVDVRDRKALEAAIAEARKFGEQVLLEEYVEGTDLRIIVIDGAVVAAAVRRPPRIQGTGRDTIRALIEKQSRRRAAATGGESRIPIDQETERCVTDAGYALDDVLPYGEYLTVRRTANLHTGGTIHDVTAQLHPTLCQAAVDAARAIDIPVTGLDFLVPDPAGADYVVIEANERPGLANHEPQPTAERFIDLLFPNTVGR
ncbi:MAG: N-acetylglutaminylglutamine synthetase [Chromatiaceae bacterium]|nr:N-acetylglutaminylglutamine synthetase [Gammaproteobacteria bacterium]MCP5301481.1 N-acetylglutaminylglutamine synthetase [Chromatiaceae bacterium]MCP5423045.1 N-acetylglutaminylglutamine synthetase [Chromatiaceae bacterium]